MTKYKIIYSNQFKKDIKLMQKRNYNFDLLKFILEILSEGLTLPEKYKNHYLKGQYDGYLECHIKPDWLLVYKYYENTLILELLRTGSHSDLFN